MGKNECYYKYFDLNLGIKITEKFRNKQYFPCKLAEKNSTPTHKKLKTTKKNFKVT